MLRASLVVIGLLVGVAGCPIAFAADLTIWWAKGFYPAQDDGIRQVAADFQAKTGTAVELTFFPLKDLPLKIMAAIAAGDPPDISNSTSHYKRLAYEGKFVDLGEIIEPIADQIIHPSILHYALLFNHETRERAYYLMPYDVEMMHIHVWKSLLEQAGIGMDQIPHEWQAFWSFWCNIAQPAVRKATGRRDIYGMGLPSSTAGSDTTNVLSEFLLAHDAWLTNEDGDLLLDQPGMRQRLVDALDDYTRPSKQGCNPPGAVSWDNPDNNVNFLSQTVLMTPNGSLSIPGSQLKSSRENYYKNIATLSWPDALNGRPLSVLFYNESAAVYAAGHNPEGAKAFLRYMTQPERLGPYIEAFQGSEFPVLRELANTPFWAEAGDPHRIMARRQILNSPLIRGWWQQSLALEKVFVEKVWPKAIDRIIVENWEVEQAVDEAIGRTKEIVEKQ